MKVLVTGGAGFIGSHTVVALIENGFKPIIVDDFRNSEKFIIARLEKICKEKLVTYDIDCSDYELMEAVFLKEKPQGVIHFAADKSVNESVNDPLKYYHNNIGSLINILKLISNYPVKSFDFSSSFALAISSATIIFFVLIPSASTISQAISKFITSPP